MTRQQKIRRELRWLRTELIEQEDDPILRAVAYAIETAVRYSTEKGIRGWESLPEQARRSAHVIKERAK